MAGTVKSGANVTCVFTTAHPSTGAATNADSLPTGLIYINGTVNAASVTVTNITTGRYKAAVTLPTLAAGDVVDLNIAATVNSIAGNAVVWSAVADTKRVSDLNDSAYAGGAVASVTAGVTVTTNNDKTGYTASTVSDKTGYSLSVTPPTAVQVRQEIDANSTKLDVAVSTRSSHSAADVWAVTTRNLSSFGTLVADIAAAVLSAIQAAGTHLTLIKAKTDLLNFTGTDVKATLDGETVAVGDKTGFALATAPATPANVTAAQDAVIAALPAAPDNSAIAAAVWASVSRTLTDFGFDVTTTVDIDAIAAAIIAAMGGVTDQLATMLEADDAGYRFTSAALEQAPSGVIGLAAGNSRLFNSASGGTARPGETISTQAAVYNQGDVARFAVTFKDDSGTPADPTLVTFKTKIGSVVASYLNDTTPAVVRDSVGVYHIDITVASPGALLWRWEGDGAVTAGLEGKIGVRPGIL